jgi:hypothetical protein
MNSLAGISRLTKVGGGVISISEYAFRRQRVAVFLSMTHCSGRIRRAYAELLELPSDLAPQGPMLLAAL